MENEYTAPVDHTAGSAAAAQIQGGVAGAVAPAAKGALGGFLAPILLGGLLLGGITAIALSGIGLVGGAILAATVIGATVGGLVFSGPLASLGGLFGGLFGGSRGAKQASDQVNAERGQATMLNAQIEMAKYNALAQQQQPTMIYAPSANNNTHFESQEAASSIPASVLMNQPSPNGIKAGNDNIQHDGMLMDNQRVASL